jgi:hypothetical protein
MARAPSPAESNIICHSERLAAALLAILHDHIAVDVELIPTLQASLTSNRLGVNGADLSESSIATEGEEVIAAGVREWSGPPAQRSNAT